MTEVPGAVNPPIVIAAFGTTSHARKTYDFMDERFRQRFPDQEIHWAFSSRMVKDYVRIIIIIGEGRIDHVGPCSDTDSAIHAGAITWSIERRSNRVLPDVEFQAPLTPV